MTKRDILTLLKWLPMDAVIGFRAHDLDETFPGEHFSTGFETKENDFAKREQGIDFLFS